MPAACRSRTYVVVLTIGWSRRHGPLLIVVGTVLAPSPRAARAVAVGQWPALCGREVRIRSPRAVPTTLLIEALAADGRWLLRHTAGRGRRGGA